MILNSILNAVFPPKCIICSADRTERGVCENCRAELVRIPPAAAVSATPREKLVNIAVFEYGGPAAIAMTKIKTLPDSRLFAFFADELATAIKTGFAGERFDCIAEIPMCPKDFKKRGYNHSLLLAKFIGKRLDIPVLSGTLREKNSAKPQHELERGERRDNVKNSVEIARPCDLSGKKILIADNIITTGSTLEHAASLFYALGAADVKACAVCRVK